MWFRKLAEGSLGLVHGGRLECFAVGFWSRVYLLWIFRNFPSLPEKVLSRRQRHFIERLRHAGNRITARSVQILLIGTVELDPVRSGATAEHAARASAEGQRVPARGVPAEVPLRLALTGTSVEVHGNMTAAAVAHPAVAPASLEPVVARKSAGNVTSITSARRAENPPVNPAPAVRSLMSFGREWAIACILGVALVACGFAVWERHQAAYQAAPARELQGDIARPQSMRAATPVEAPVLEAALPQQIAGTTTARTPGVTSDSPVPAAPAMAKPTVQAPRPGSPRTLIDESSLVPSNLRPLRIIYPEYPEGARATGKVSLSVVVNPDGTPATLRVLNGDSNFTAAALAAVGRWRYPAYSPPAEGARMETQVNVNFLGPDAVIVRFVDPATAR